jgi:hypothetical protein
MLFIYIQEIIFTAGSSLEIADKKASPPSATGRIAEVAGEDVLTITITHLG